MSGRVVVVLGYSNGGEALHDICAARLRRAAGEARPDDTVLLTGWARRPILRTEAELMADAWEGAGELVVSGDERSTFGNARATAAIARARGASEVVLVTSAWHQRRAAALLRAALRASGIGIALAPAPDDGSVRIRVREIICWALVPFQSAVARRASVGETRGRAV